MIAYTQADTGEHHLALVRGSWEPDEPILVSGSQLVRYRRHIWFVPVRLRAAAA